MRVRRCAVGLAADLLEQRGHDITELTLIPSRGGVFEVTVDATQVFSKRALGRHAEPGEISAALDDLAT